MRKSNPDKKETFYHVLYLFYDVWQFLSSYSYRLQHAFDQDAPQVSSFVRNVTIRTKIIAAIEIHKRALELVYAFSLKLLTNYTYTSHNIYSIHQIEYIRIIHATQRKSYFANLISPKSYCLL